LNLFNPPVFMSSSEWADIRTVFRYGVMMGDKSYSSALRTKFLKFEVFTPLNIKTVLDTRFTLSWFTKRISPRKSFQVIRSWAPSQFSCPNITAGFKPAVPFTMKMEAPGFFETLLPIYDTTRYNIREDSAVEFCCL
jgi:hypothetical protein